jgi:hypothetical protein
VRATRGLLRLAGPGMVCLAILVGPVPSLRGQEGQPGQTGAGDQKVEQEKLAQEKKLAAEKEKKLAEEKAAEQKKLAGEKQGGAPGQGAGERKPEPAPNALWLEGSVRLTKALQELIAGLLGGISWAVVALVVLFLFREKLLSVFMRLVETICERGGSVDVGTFKLHIAERADEMDEARPLFLPSPFDLEDDRGSDGGLLWEIPPQYEYEASDYVGQYRERYLGGQAAANAMRQAFAAVELSCRNGEAFAALKPKLLAYVVALEEARFLEAAALVRLMASYTPLSDGIRSLRPTELLRDAEDFLIVHASAIALAQHGDVARSLELLNDIPWRKDQPLYVPAGAMWLTASYHGLMARLRRDDKPLDTSEVLTNIREFVERANLLAEELKKLDWTTVKLRAPKAYYTREFDKDIGDVLAIYAEHVALPQRGKLLLEAKEYLERCVQPNADEEPTPLDHNNLADLYRQLGALAGSNEAGNFYERAHTEIDAALPQNVTPDPTFHDTLALLLLAENRLDEAAAVLDPYLGDNRVERLCAEDRYQCIRNQILAAKLSVRRLEDEGARRAIDILESTLRLIAKTRGELRGKADALDAEITELLSFAHLRLDDHQDEAVAHFDRLIKSAGWRPSPAAELRARVGRALALGGHARRERRHSSYGVAEALRARAAEDVRRITELLKEVKLDASQSPERLRTLEGLWLDAVRAIQLLAEELYAGHESKAAQDLAGQELAPLLAALGERIRSGAAVSDRRRVLRRVQARNALLRARLQLRLDPNLSAAETLPKVLESLQSARGAEAHLDCQADLEEGVVRLTAARLGTGDVEREYAKAVEALERATREDVPALRSETIRLLAHAYAMGPQIRRAKKSATK